MHSINDQPIQLGNQQNSCRIIRRWNRQIASVDELSFFIRDCRRFHLSGDAKLVRKMYRLRR
jgi:hypothetical protein